MSASPFSLSASAIADDDEITITRKFSFEGLATESKADGSEQGLGGLLEAIDDVARMVGRHRHSGSEGSSVKSEDEAVTPVDAETPAEYRAQQAEALRGLLGLVLVEGEDLGLAREEGKVVAKGRTPWDEEEREMRVRGLGKFSADEYLDDLEVVRGVFV